MGQNFNKNTYHATGQAAYLDLEAAKNNFDALASSFCGPQDPAALGFSEPGMLWLNNSTGILSQRNESNSAWVTLFDLRNQRVATGRVTAASISNSARKPSLVTGQAISPGSCSLHTPNTTALASLRANFAVGNYQLASQSVSYQFSGTSGPTGYSYARAAAFRLGWPGALRVVVSFPGSGTIHRAIVARNGTPVGTHIESINAINQSEDISGWSAGDLLELYVQNHVSLSGTWTIKVCASAPKFGAAAMLKSAL